MSIISVTSKCVTCMFVFLQAGGSTGLLMDLAANEKSVHADFFNGNDMFLFITYSDSSS